MTDMDCITLEIRWLPIGHSADRPVAEVLTDWCRDSVGAGELEHLGGAEYRWSMNTDEAMNGNHD